MRLIDAYALQDKIHKSKIQNPHTDARAAANHDFEHDHFMKMVVLQPTAQEEIVRCKDCKHQYEYRTGSCPYYTTYGSVPQDDWYCADGKRKEGR